MTSGLDRRQVLTLVARSEAELIGARRVIAPSADAAGRYRRHFRALAVEVAPWEDDATLPASVRRGFREELSVAVIGAISVAKGYEIPARRGARRGMAGAAAPLRAGRGIRATTGDCSRPAGCSPVRHIKNREGLENASCECYRIIHEEFVRLGLL